MDERVSQEQAAALYEAVSQFRHHLDGYAKPDDVNKLLSLFASVSVQEGYILDYVQVGSEADVASWILPYARRPGDSPAENMATVPHH